MGKSEQPKPKMRTREPEKLLSIPSDKVQIHSEHRTFHIDCQLCHAERRAQNSKCPLELDMTEVKSVNDFTQEAMSPDFKFQSASFGIESGKGLPEAN